MKPCDRDVCWHYVPLTNTANVYLDTPNSSCSNDRTNKQLRQVSRCSQRAVQSMRLAIKVTRASAALPWERWGLQIYSVLVLTWIKAKECFLSVKVQSHCWMASLACQMCLYGDCMAQLVQLRSSVKEEGAYPT